MKDLTGIRVEHWDLEVILRRKEGQRQIILSEKSEGHSENESIKSGCIGKFIQDNHFNIAGEVGENWIGGDFVSQSDIIYLIQEAIGIY